MAIFRTRRLDEVAKRVGIDRRESSKELNHPALQY